MNNELTSDMRGEPTRDRSLPSCRKGSMLNGALSCVPGPSRPRSSPRAFTLIELIGVLAVIALLAAALVPVVIRQMDRIAGEQESAALKSLGNALQQSIMRVRSSGQHYIPGIPDWVATIAAELGANVSDVTINGRQQPRFFLIDPNWQIGGRYGGQSYTQSTAGTVLATNLRVIFLSSIGQQLTNMSSGVQTTNDFNAIWDWNDGSSIAPTNATIMAGFTKGEDLKVQRVNLSPLFVRLLLTTNASTTKCFYSIDPTGSTSLVTNGVDSYFIRNSILFLYAAPSSAPGQTNIDSQRILARDTSFVYDQDVWRDSIGGRTGGSSSIAGLDFGSIVDQYLRAPENTNAFFTLTNNAHGNTNSVTQQSVVVSKMIAYLDAYNAWAAQYAGQNPWPKDSYYNTASVAQAALVIAVQQQYQSGGGGNDYTPYSDSRCP